MGTLLTVLLIEIVVITVGGRLIGRRRGQIALGVHLLVLTLGWIIGVWLRTAARCSGQSECPPDADWWTGGLLGVLLLALPVLVSFWGGLLPLRRFFLPLRDKRDMWDALWCMVGFIIGRNRPYYMATEPLIADGQLIRTFEGKIVSPLLGPGVIQVNSHYAVPLTSGPELTRVEAPRLIFTRRKERPLQVVDLRPHIRTLPLQPTTKDGVEIKTLLFLVFRIDAQGVDNPHQQLFPFSENAVFAAVRSQKAGRDKGFLWDEFVVDAARGIGYDVFAEYRFDEMQGTAARERLRSEIEKRLRQAIGQRQPGTGLGYGDWHGITLMGVGLSNIEASSAQVADWRVEEWRAPLAAQATRLKAQGEAEAIKTLGQARADAQRQMVTMLLDRLRDAQSLPADQAASLIILRSVEMMEQMAQQLPPPDQQQAEADLSAALKRMRKHES